MDSWGALSSGRLIQEAVEERQALVDFVKVATAGTVAVPAVVTATKATSDSSRCDLSCT